MLFEVISRAYERASLIATTDLPFEAWTEVMGNEPLTGTPLDRLTHRIHILDANGESYRLGESMRRGLRDAEIGGPEQLAKVKAVHPMLRNRR